MPQLKLDTQQRNLATGEYTSNKVKITDTSIHTLDPVNKACNKVCEDSNSAFVLFILCVYSFHSMPCDRVASKYQLATQSATHRRQHRQTEAKQETKEKRGKCNMNGEYCQTLTTSACFL